MNDLISRKALLEELEAQDYYGGFLVRLITNAPAIEQGEPVAWQFYIDGRWHDGMRGNNHKQDAIDAGDPVRELYTAPPQSQTVKDALEKAARICEKMQKDENNTHIGERCSYGTCQIQGSTFAKAIRALIEKE